MPRSRPDKAIKAARASNWVLGILAALIAVGALVVGTVFGNISSRKVNPQLISWVSAAVYILAGIVATARLSTALSHFTTRRAIPAARAAVKMLSAVAGYLLVIFGLLGIVGGLGKLLVGAGVAGVVLGIAAQQSLGNVFAGFVLLLARPFSVGDHIRLRSGALGGIFDAWVIDMSLTYVTVQTDDGPLKIPNSGMLAAGVAQLPPVSSTPPAPVVPPAPGPAAPPPAPTAAPPPAPAAPTPGSPAPGPLGGGDLGQAAAEGQPGGT